MIASSDREGLIDKIAADDIWERGETLPFDKKLLYRAIEEELTERQREVVTDYYLKHMTIYKIAEALGLSVSTVSRTLTRGRANLRRALKYSLRQSRNPDVFSQGT